MNSWIRDLASHYERTREQHPDRKLLVLFDIDGTILDMRYMIRHILREFDREHNSTMFQNLSLGDINVHESQIQLLLQQLRVPEEQQSHILDFYTSRFWTSDAVLEAHRPFRGILELIRWFQLQPGTYVGLNSSRPEYLRSGTLNSLNRLAQEYRVQFSNDLLHMNRHGWNRENVNAKLEGLRFFREKGYFIFAVIDNEPANLYAISRKEAGDEMLLLHADTIFASKRRSEEQGGVNTVYAFPDLAGEGGLPRHINFVWHGINNESRLRDFLASNIHWAAMDVRLEPTSRDLVLRRESFGEMPLDDEEVLMPFEIGLYRCRQKDRGVKIHIRENGSMLERVLEALDAHHFAPQDIWFNGEIDCVKREGFEKLARRYPGAVIQCPMDFLSPLILGAPGDAESTLRAIQRWGVNRFSLEWRNPRRNELFKRMSAWGFEVSIRDVPDFESFMQATLLQPHSITSDFNFSRHLQAEAFRKHKQMFSGGLRSRAAM